MNESELAKLQSRNTFVTPGQWKDILQSILLQNSLEESASKALQKLEVMASVVGKQLQIVFRNNISGIHQRLGELTLAEDRTEEIDTLAWVNLAVSRANGMEGELKDLSDGFQQQAARIQELTQKLDVLRASQKRQEALLLEKFEKLLNKKKLKIRDQQRLLATSKVNAKIGMLTAKKSLLLGKLSVVAAEHVQLSRSPSQNHTSAIPRPNKRKPNIELATSTSDSEDSGFEKVAVEDPNAATPESSDQETASDDDDLDGRPQAGLEKRRVGTKGNASETATHEMEVEQSPKRSLLPIGKIGGRNSKTESRSTVAKQPNRPEDTQKEEAADEDETSDDEL